MTKTLVLIGSFALVVCIGLSGCDQISNLFLSDADKLVGTWNADGIWVDVPTELEFFSNGTVEGKVQMGTIDFTFKNGTWAMQDGILTIELGDLIPLTTFSYQFSESDKKLTLTDKESNDTFILTK